MDDINKIINDLQKRGMLNDKDGNMLDDKTIGQIKNKYKNVGNNSSRGNSVGGDDFKSSIVDVIAGATLQPYAPEDTNILKELAQNYKPPTDGGSQTGAVISSLIKTAMSGIGDYVKEQSY